MNRNNKFFVMNALDEKEILDNLSKVSKWVHNNGYLEREIEFSKYLDSIEFINKVAIIAEKQDHHPKLTSNFKSLLIQLTTHDVEGVSQKDFHLAKAIDTLKFSLPSSINFFSMNIFSNAYFFL